MVIHLALLVGEAALSGGIILALFRQRRRIGLAPLYLVLGTLQFAQFVLATSIRIEIAAGLAISPAAAVLFPLTVFVVLLTYVEEDAEATRSLAYGIVLCNLTFYAVAYLAAQHLRYPGHENVLGLRPDLVVQPLRVVVASSLAIVADMLVAIVVFEAISRALTGALFLRLWTTALVVMVIDSLLFATVAFAFRPAFWNILAASLVAKVLGATFYAALVTAYLRLIEQPPMPLAGDTRRDVFAWLTYRQRYEEVRSKMSRDALTGLYNRGYFDEDAPRQLAHAGRAGHEVSLVLIDVDHLKTTNDRYGHQAGDDLLRFVAREIQQIVRASNTASRYGGDEFAVVLSDAGAAAARVFADRLSHNVRTNSLARPSPPRWAPAAVSIGIATYPADSGRLDDLLRCADARLYDSKRRGGDLVTDAAGVM